MQSIFDLCTPRTEVLQGELREDIFAARLQDVMNGKADPVYGDPATFFDNTYPTAGLKTLLADVLGRLTGKAAGKNAVIRLETAFGGGKTHNLIALYHVASGQAPKSVSSLLGKGAVLPKPDRARGRSRL
jgi:predicted AAA+ superfamily ATPase